MWNAGNCQFISTIQEITVPPDTISSSYHVMLQIRVFTGRFPHDVTPEHLVSTEWAVEWAVPL